MIDPINEYNSRKQAEELVDVFDAFKRELDNPNRKRKLLKTIPMRPEWKNRFDKLYEDARTISLLTSKLTTQRNKLWGDINETLDDYSPMSYNPDSGEIEIYDTDIRKNA